MAGDAVGFNIFHFVKTHLLFATQSWTASCLESSTLYAHLLSLRVLILCGVSVLGNLFCQVVADLGVLDFMQAELGSLDCINCWRRDLE